MRGDAPAEVTVTIVGPSGAARELSLPADRPVAELTGALAAAAGVTAVTSVLVRGGGILQSPDTLATAGVEPGATLLVGGSRPAGEGRRRATLEVAASSPAPRGRWWAVAAVALVVGLVAGGVVGAVAFERERTSSVSLSAQQTTVADSAVADWLAGRGGIAGRTGPAIRAGVEPVGPPQATTNSWPVQRYVVLPASGAPYGLTVVLAGSASHPRVAYPLGYTRLQFATGSVPKGGRAMSAAGLSGTVADWASATFGPRGSLTTALGVGQAGPVRVVSARVPSGRVPSASGRGSVTSGRGSVTSGASSGAASGIKVVLVVIVPLSSVAPGTPDGAVSATARSDAQAVAQANQKVASDKNAINRAQAAATQAFATANVPAFQAAQTQLAQAQAGLQADQMALTTAQQRANASAARARSLPAATQVNASYELAVNDRDQVVAWAAAGDDGS